MYKRQVYTTLTFLYSVGRTNKLFWTLQISECQGSPCAKSSNRLLVSRRNFYTEVYVSNITSRSYHHHTIIPVSQIAIPPEYFGSMQHVAYIVLPISETNCKYKIGEVTETHYHRKNVVEKRPISTNECQAMVRLINFTIFKDFNNRCKIQEFKTRVELMVPVSFFSPYKPTMSKVVHYPLKARNKSISIYSLCNLTSLQTVSYTHLDVYKRQN